jgi:hypothetical protein
MFSVKVRFDLTESIVLVLTQETVHLPSDLFRTKERATERTVFHSAEKKNIRGID